MSLKTGSVLIVLLTVLAANPVAAGDLGTGPLGKFHFHSSAEMNLFHFLYHWARADWKDEKLFGRVSISEADRDQALTPQERETWKNALEAIHPLVGKDLLFDDELWKLKTAIATRTGDKPLNSVHAAIRDALPVYRKTWWPRHDAANREAHGKLLKQIETYGAGLARTVADGFDSKWGDEPIRVDIVAYANWAGAYTTNFPNHIVFSSTDPRLRALQRLEMIFHEAGHTIPLGERLIPTTRRVSAELGVEEARLWHSIIFYVAGNAMRTVLPTETASSYTPYAEVNGLWNRGSMRGQLPALETGWEQGDTLEERVRATYRAIGGERAACPPGEGVAVQVLGSGGPIADDARASTAYLVWADGAARVLIDIGGGAFLRFGESGASFEELDFIGLSHFHTDHSADLPALLKSGYFSSRERPLPISGPGPGGPFPGLEKYLDALLHPETGAYGYLSGYLDGSDGLVQLEPAEIPVTKNVGSTVTVLETERLRVQAKSIPHGIVPALAYRLRIGGMDLVFGGDQNGSDPSFVEFAQEADLLVMHMAIPPGAGEVAKKLHPSPSRIGAIAKAAGVKSLLLSHFMARSLHELDRNVEIVRRAYDGRVVVAEDLACVLP